jgi:hypothetical protein
MSKKNIIAFTFILLGLIFSFLSMPVSGALNSGRFERTATAWVADDRNAMLLLKGLDNQNYNLDINYSNIGIITNNTNQKITLTVVVTADFGGLNNKNCNLGIMIGNKANVIRNDITPFIKIVTELAPGQSADVSAFLDRNQNNLVKVSFDITAENSQGTFSMKLTGTGKTPRQIYCY